MHINDHPDFDGRYMQWCEHLNVMIIGTFGQGATHFICEDCGNTCLIEQAEQWPPNLIGTRLP
jgi:hypothetical protein